MRNGKRALRIDAPLLELSLLVVQALRELNEVDAAVDVFRKRLNEAFILFEAAKWRGSRQSRSRTNSRCVVDVAAALCVIFRDIDWCGQRRRSADDLMIVGERVRETFDRVHRVLVLIEHKHVARHATGALERRVRHLVELGNDRVHDRLVNRRAARHVVLVIA